ncbi:MAG: alkaline phosphatase D family protein [Bacteroidales bacterium]
MIKSSKTIFQFLFLSFIYIFSVQCFGQITDTILPRYKITLPEAHIGNLDIDLQLLESYQPQPENVKQFYIDARNIFSENKNADFTNKAILYAARKHDIALIGGPMLGNLKENSVTLWFRPVRNEPVEIKVIKKEGSEEKSYYKNLVEPGIEQRVKLDGLSSNTSYTYEVYSKMHKIGAGSFRTPPIPDEPGVFKLAFGSCLHKIGLHNPNLVNQVLRVKPRLMMLMGDIAVDDRENNINMHRSDYLLRDLSDSWQKLSSNIPIYAAWDDHDYLNNDLSGIPARFTESDQAALREVWHQNWNNPENRAEGIYFNTRVGPVEIIMLDTRSCRDNKNRGQYGSYLGFEQQDWLKETLRNSTAPIKVISSGTMWSDYVSNGKDSWGTWDKLGREEIFNLIEKENIPGVLLISGDRHGARGFTIPRPSGFSFYEFEAASLGGVRGPPAMAEDTTNQLFGYFGTDVIAFGEFTFDTTGDKPVATFRLIDQFGKILEEHVLTYGQLTPRE